MLISESWILWNKALSLVSRLESSLPYSIYLKHNPKSGSAKQPVKKNEESKSKVPAKSSTKATKPAGKGSKAVSKVKYFFSNPS